jgi:hypothetical protein
MTMSEADEKAIITIEKFCCAGSRTSYESRPHSAIFPRGALELAALSDEWPKLLNQMLELLAHSDFLDPRVSVTVSVLERNLHLSLMSALEGLAVGQKRPPEALPSLTQVVSRWRKGQKSNVLRLAAYDAWYFVRSSKKPNN